ncbi:MAG: hypothetical protein D6785_05480 [Planctomycetota bacterium]|nr:MAG: hypothetical protein D6785_05480 [Planctomycetota bacterium]
MRSYSRKNLKFFLNPASRGMSYVELMISTSIFGIILAATYFTFFTTESFFQTSSQELWNTQKSWNLLETIEAELQKSLWEGIHIYGCHSKISFRPVLEWDTPFFLL